MCSDSRLSVTDTVIYGYVFRVVGVCLSPTFGGHTTEYRQSDIMTMDNAVLGSSNLLKGELCNRQAA